MARQKQVKVNYKQLSNPHFDDNNNLIGIAPVETETDVVDTEINITEEIKKLLSTLNVDEDSIVVNIKKFKEKVEKEKQPIYKYKCSCEDGREIKSKCEYLNIHCNDCDEDFKIIDNDK